MAAGKAGVKIDQHHLGALALGHFLDGRGAGTPGRRVISAEAVHVVNRRVVL